MKERRIPVLVGGLFLESGALSVVGHVVGVVCVILGGCRYTAEDA